MKCYFLRHGIAMDREAWSGSDNDRPLTGEGIERMESEAKAIAALALDLDAIVTSPLRRAKQTAEIVARALKMSDALVEDRRVGADDFGPAAFAAVVENYPDAGAIMLVGHEPNFSETIGHLIGGARIALKKGGLACVDLPDPASRAGTLLWLLPPKTLTARR